MIKSVLTVILTSLTCLSCNSQQATGSKNDAAQDDVYTTKSGKQVTFTFIKHASLEIKYDGLSIQVDPVQKLPLETDYSKFNKSDFIFVTHEHFDHFDKDAIATLSGDKTLVVLNKRCAEMYPSSSYAGESYKRIVDYDLSIKNYTAATEILERVFEDYPDAPWLDEMLLKWGVVMYRLGDRQGARQKFQRVIEEYPGGKSAKTAKSFLDRLGADDDE